ncbi:IBR finger domain protein [Fusarium beomiforme]|uniref:RBR-type E3 ubiquitin transferase n=1 Tax=Fusarium beomiforme TaxID=44412 RepID=A0A9P5AIF5_9HYPO|nr:IBR finger domain protein [Fusarium beomiforme]
MDTSSLMLALQLQQQDLNLWEQSRKGKQREGQVTDSDMALEACRRELEAMAAQISDQALALSIAKAVETDGQAIREAQLAEEQAARDREYAIRLSENPSARARPTSTKQKKAQLADEVDDELIDILRSMNLGSFDDSKSGKPESSSWAASRKPSQTRKCIACNDSFPSLALSKSPCSHDYCRECLVGLVRSSLQDETLFPPRCCGQNIPVTQGRWFSPKLVGQFQAKKLEFDTPNRTYCNKLTCSTFVPPAFIAGDIATCPRCQERTCIHCKGRYHRGVCPNDTAAQQMLQLAAENGWQRCYACHRVVELDIGCNHMTCICRAEFCYVCGERWKNCDCPQWQEERLVRRANDIVDRDDNAGRMDAQVRQARVERERANLIENHECTHDRIAIEPRSMEGQVAKDFELAPILSKDPSTKETPAEMWDKDQEPTHRQQCYSCAEPIELGIGSQQTTCLCGAQFCSSCGKRWKTCACQQHDEERGEQRADSVDPDECEHEVWEKRKDGVIQYLECYDILEEYSFKV